MGINGENMKGISHEKVIRALNKADKPTSLKFLKRNRSSNVDSSSFTAFPVPRGVALPGVMKFET